MKTILFSLLLTYATHAQIDPERLANAIYRAENSKRYPYGIVSIPLKGDTQAAREAYARRICLNTIRNNIARWERAGKTNDFITFLGNRYAPVGVANDPNRLNSNWIKNVKQFYARR